MSELHTLKIHNSYSLDEAWKNLEEAGFQIAYGEEENGIILLHLFLRSDEKLPTFPWIIACQKSELPLIDWDSQWAQHGLNFNNGLLTISLCDYERNIPAFFLKPGPGFGDLSHPTTHLTLKLLCKHLKNEKVIDIGCGSGILTVAAVKMGASFAYGLDIDEAALKHSSENAILNKIDNLCCFKFPNNFDLKSQEPVIILMNMISSEQIIAWDSLPSLHTLKGLLLISGISLSEKNSYLRQARLRGWKLKDELEQNEWLGFSFALS
ncbi:MAG: 50S ribosomal protein L11 methyltransferase [Candidatus Protochlamydia sp.]|nr:50S ribosomal protein L11 methyltransferase [Candidatus Protochlamydia sp.]